MENYHVCIACNHHPNKGICTAFLNRDESPLKCMRNVSKGIESIEEFKPLERCPDLYEVSSLGRLRDISNPEKPQILEQVTNSEGYAECHLFIPDKYNAISGRVAIHKEVQASFMDDKKSNIDHINRIRTDARLSNLRVCSQAENNLNRTDRDPISNFYGVKFNILNSQWEAFGAQTGDKKSLGMFNSSYLAAKARDLYMLNRYGYSEFVEYNFEESVDYYNKAMKEANMMAARDLIKEGCNEDCVRIKQDEESYVLAARFLLKRPIRRR